MLTKEEAYDYRHKKAVFERAVEEALELYMYTFREGTKVTWIDNIRSELNQHIIVACNQPTEMIYLPFECLYNERWIDPLILQQMPHIVREREVQIKIAQTRKDSQDETDYKTYLHLKEIFEPKD